MKERSNEAAERGLLLTADIFFSHLPEMGPTIYRTVCVCSCARECVHPLKSTFGSAIKFNRLIKRDVILNHHFWLFGFLFIYFFRSK